MKGVLVTGAAGFIGSRLVRSYLDRDGYRVFALLRGRSQEHAEQRMREVLDFWEVPKNRVDKRLVVLRGDILEADLGLGPEEVATVHDEVQLFVHGASPLRLDQTLEGARHGIVGATERALGLFDGCRHRERFGFMSTLEVAGDTDELVHEDFLSRSGRQFMNTYEIAKFECEELLERRIADGAPITVFRPGMVVGDAATGKALRFQTFYLILERMLLRPLAPVMPGGSPLDTVPVDIVADGTAALMEHPAAAGRVYHLTQGTADEVGFQSFLDMVQPLAEARLGHPVRRPLFLPPSVFRAPLRVARHLTFGTLRRRVETLLVFFSYLGLGWRFDTTETRAALAELGVAWPSLADCLPTLLDYYIEHRGQSRLPF